MKAIFIITAGLLFAAAATPTLTPEIHQRSGEFIIMNPRASPTATPTPTVK